MEKLNGGYKLLEKKERQTDRVEKRGWRSGVQHGSGQQMELAGSLVGPSREIEVAFLRSY